MHSFSHSTIGKFIHSYINDNIGLNVSLKDLKIGCMKPDFIPNLINIPHYKPESFHFISDMITSLQNWKLPVDYRELKEYSSKLGIILHYITDYFCFPHNNKAMNKMPNHFIYELGLDIELRRFLSSYILIASMNFSEDYYRSLNISLIDYIEEKHERYLKEKQGLSNDIHYILQSCCTVSMNIITQSMMRSYPETA